MDAEERGLFAKSLEHATARHTGAELDAALAELGWRDAFAADPRAAVATLFELQGATATTSGALDVVLADALGPGPASAPGPDGGVGVVLPALGASDPPGRVEGDRLVVRGLGTADLARRSGVLVVAPSADGAIGEPGGLVALVLDPADLDLRTVDGIDPRLGLVTVAADVARSSGTRLDGVAGGAPDWAAAVDAGRRALAHELVGASRAMLELARQHALERVQFGRPIAQFQAIRHKLAESLVAIEAADGALAAAWDDPSPTASAIAKAIAGRSARTVARHAQQVLAGIGFTTEHSLHLYVRRVLVLDRLLGGAGALTLELGDDLLAARSLPAMLPL
ncbi:MAG TPA: acyl-CoA dehydrogenase family protein [Acidimicrobiales bacterium]|nr:acyl-CoA dehydrogenase family protein [Acidimicrobiales bacterium]